MDTITHGLFGIVIYQSIYKEQMSKEMKRALLFTSVAGSELPDIDVISQLWDTGQRYLMWHRGITHSVFFVPLWAALLTCLTYLFWHRSDRKLFAIGLLAVFIHVTIDNFNAWGTGYLEPFSQQRIAWGTMPIVDPVIWAIILFGFVAARMKKWRTHLIYRAVSCLIVIHVFAQSLQGYTLYQSAKAAYQQVTLAANFVPGSFRLIGKKQGVVEISQVSVWQKPKLLERIPTDEQADLQSLFEQNPAAKTLYEWAPMVVVVNNEKRLGIFDPRFYRNGESFLSESIVK